MAQRSDTQPKSTAQAATSSKRIWWVTPAIIGCCILAVVFAYLHVHYGSTTPAEAVVTAVVGIAVFLVSYTLLRRIPPKHNTSTLISLINSLLVALPVFILAFIALAFEIAELADITAMYIFGTWVGSSEAAERMAQEQ
ncbi:MAG TPA: hypothetical protein PLU88_14090 [Armatimonadota bacterium]|nr:hypothetical protein [Armatimonadota bacterium]HOM71635.1 hypothetical protein [Armatimonadota bacterium]HOP81027.1 hypothetical protein [Armatimonadota bacterium]HPP76248.1 hypothetical protein [Armatimonadota bacterium]